MFIQSGPMSSTEQWSNLIKNPYDVVDGNNGEISENMMDLLNSRNNSNNLGSVYGGQDYPLPDEAFENFNPVMDINIEEFLTKELRDLDIPVLPKDELSKLDLEMFPGNGLDWNVVNDNDASVGVGNVNTEIPSITPRKLMPGGGAAGNHKKKPSGTAIFGFAQHNKSLSIGSMTINLDEKKQAFLQQEQQKLLQAQQASQPAEIKMSETIMQQQKELQLALQRQKEMNEKLEDQLRMNKLQQEQLQRALEAQQMTLNQVSSIPTTTPVRPETSIIITSNGKNGKYQFPPPSSDDSSQQRQMGERTKLDESPNKDVNKVYGVGAGNGLLSPFSRASVNGSPHRRRQHNYDGVENGNNRLAPPMNFSISSTSTVGNNTEQLLKMSKYFQELTDNQSRGPSNCAVYNKKSSNRPPITPQDQIYDNPKTPSMNCNYKHTTRSDDGLETASSIDSNINNKNSHQNKHFARDSTISTASTIPMQSEDDHESEQTQQQPSLGLGITLNSRVQLKKPPQLQIMPMIPGSSETTPLKQKQSPDRQFSNKLNSENMPVKHSFQHTPTKKLIFDKTVTTSLRPDDRKGQNARNIILASRDGEEDMKSGRLTNMNNGNNDEPECEFVQAQTPSPILRSQERFDCIAESPVHFPYNQHNHVDLGLGPNHNGIGLNTNLNTSPMVSGGRNGKRYGMLPREQIDKYILEIGPKQFQCKFKDCQKRFNRRYNARTHIQTHLCDRPYKCDFPGCQKAFVRNHDLLRHKKSHLEKGYSCAGCGKKFHSEDSLVKHQERKSHEGRLDEEDLCNQEQNHDLDYYDHLDSSPIRLNGGNQIRKPVSPKKVPNVIRENIQRGHTTAALRVQEQLTYNQTTTGV